VLDLVGKRVTILDRDGQGVVGHGTISSFSIDENKKEGSAKAQPIQAGVEFSLDVEMTDRQLINLLWALLAQQQIRLQAEDKGDS
jgi:hypothetical protein